MRIKIYVAQGGTSPIHWCKWDFDTHFSVCYKNILIIMRWWEGNWGWAVDCHLFVPTMKVGSSQDSLWVPQAEYNSTISRSFEWKWGFPAGKKIKIGLEELSKWEIINKALRARQADSCCWANFFEWQWELKLLTGMDPTATVVRTLKIPVSFE